MGLVERDPSTSVDVVTSLMLDFPSGQAIGTCSTRMVPYQSVSLFGTAGRLRVEVPFNAPNDRPCRLFIDDGRDVFESGVETVELATCAQYRIQGDRFARAILDDTDVLYPLEKSVWNMRWIEAIFRSAETGRWETAG